MAAPDLDAAVMYYGRMVSDPEQLRAIEAPVLGVFGDRDRGIPPEVVNEFERAMKEAEREIEIHRYDADHAFANPSSARYDGENASKVIEGVKDMLARSAGVKWPTDWRDARTARRAVIRAQMQRMRQAGMPTAEVIDKVIDVQMPLLTISIDGGTKETFESIRTPMKWEKMMSHFDRVREFKEKRGSKYPLVSATTVLMRRTIREMPELVRIMADKGVEQMNFVHMGVIGGLGVEDESLLNEPKLSNDILAECKQLCDELGIHSTMPLPFPENFGGHIDGEGHCATLRATP